MGSHRVIATAVLVTAIQVLSLPPLVGASVKSTPKLTCFVFRQVDYIEPARGVVVFLVEGESVRQVGTTDEKGTVSLDKDLLRRTNVKLILFCETQKSWSCNAVRLDADRDAVLGFDEVSIRLGGGLEILDRGLLGSVDKPREGD